MRLIAGRLNRRVLTWLLLLATAALAGCSSSNAVLPSGATDTPVPSRSATAVPPGEAITAPFDLPIMMYHHVSIAPPPQDVNNSLSPEAFAQQLNYLQSAGYTPITIAQMFEAVAGRSRLPNRPIILTFDDGYEDQYAEALPLLKQHGFVASFAIISGFVEGGGPYMTWAQMREMAKDGMEFTSHTVTHIDMNTSDDDTVRGEAAESKRSLEEHLGQTIRFLVYPSGEPFRSGSEERQNAVISILKEEGYEGALLAGPSTTRQDPQTPFALSRVRVGNGESIEGYAASIGGPPAAASR